MADIDRMSPHGSPAGMGRAAGVRRVNNLPLYIAISAVAAFLLIMVLVAADRAAGQSRPDAVRSENAGSSNAFAQEIAGARKDGIIQAELSVPPEVPAPLSIDIARPDPDNLDAPPLPPQAAGPAAVDEDSQRVRMLKLQQLEEAIKAKTGVRLEAARSAASAPVRGGAAASREEALARLAAARQQIDAQAQGDPTAAYQARLQQLQRGGQGAAALAAVSAEAGEAEGRDYARFGSPGPGGDRWQLDARPEAPRGPYLLRAGFVLPAMLISGINSDLPGQIVAQVSQDVFDTATGKWKLIPQGARLVGQYASEVAYGQSRVLVAWQRIVFPDGKAMDIGAMPGADGAGQAGLRDRTNNHYVRLFGSALLMSGVTAGIAMSQRETPSPFGGAPTTSSALSEALGQQLGQVTAQMIAKNMGIAPTLEIRPGYRFNVIVTKDLGFPRPYQAFDY